MKYSSYICGKILGTMEEIKGKSLPFYPVRKGDEFYCFSPVKVSDMNGNSWIAYTAGHTYVSEQDDCITDDQGDKGHIWTPDGYGMLVGNFMYKTKEAPMLITKGSWVVRGESVCCVDEVVDRDKVMVIVPSLFGGIKTLCYIKEVHPWSLNDAKYGDYLCLEEGENRVIYITRGFDDDVHSAIAGCNTDGNRFWRDQICCRANPNGIRPATDQEKYLLNTIIEQNGYNWNLDKKQLEEKPRHYVDISPAGDDRHEKLLAELEKQRLMIDELNEKVEKLQKSVGFIASKDIKLGGNSCV